MPVRTALILITTLLLTSCVSSGKFKRTSLNYQAMVDMLGDDVERQQDSINSLRLNLERSWGANDALLRTQDKLQDRLFKQEDEMDDLRGNLSSTSTKLSGELTAAKAEIKAAKASEDSLRLNQKQLVTNFEAGLVKASAAIQAALESTLEPGQYSVSLSGGELRLSVQEDVLFAPKSVTKLEDQAEIILRAVMDALQADPLLKLTVVGHTDNKPNPRRGTNNWEYASLRATRLAEELADVYYLSPNRIVAASQGEYGPLTSNATDEGRATNRRIDFVLRNNVANLLRELNKL